MYELCAAVNTYSLPQVLKNKSTRPISGETRFFENGREVTEWVTGATGGLFFLIVREIWDKSLQKNN